jgi:hypothetical protein
MDFKRLSKDNFMLYAIGHYSNPDCLGMAEFNEDLAKIKYVKRLLKKYCRTGKLRPILLLNHLVILGNVFGAYPASRMLFYKLEAETHPALKTVLLYLNYIHDGMVFDTTEIETVLLDQKLAQILKGL